MRYIIIPILITLYILWTNKSVRDLIKYKNNQYYDVSTSTDFWIAVHIGGLLFTIVRFLIVPSIEFVIKNW